MDSYVKFANSVFRDYFNAPLFANVHAKDREEVAVDFAIMVADDLDNYADSFRVTPTCNLGIANRDEHDAKQTCCGRCDRIVRCRSGRNYFIGFNYGH